MSPITSCTPFYGASQSAAGSKKSVEVLKQEYQGLSKMRERLLKEYAVAKKDAGVSGTSQGQSDLADKWQEILHVGVRMSESRARVEYRLERAQTAYSGVAEDSPQSEWSV